MQVLKTLFASKPISWDGLVQDKGHISYHQELDIDRPLMKGAYGTVYHGNYHLFSIDEPETTFAVAVKDFKSKSSAHNEVDCLYELRDEKDVIHLYNYYESGDRALLVEELCAGGDLFEYFHKKKRPFTEEETRQVLQWLLRAIQECHEHGICHADIKLDNIGLVNPGDLGSLKLLDFGLSKRMNKSWPPNC